MAFVIRLNFYMEFNERELPFLDTKILKEDQTLSTMVYCKPADRNSLLHASSSLLKQGLPYSQFLKIRRICSNRTDFDIESRKLYDQFLARGYKRQWMDLALEKVNNLDDLSFKNSGKKKKSSVVCCTTYTPISKDLKKTLLKNICIF